MMSDERIRELIVAYLNISKPSSVNASALFGLCKQVALEAALAANEKTA